MDQKVHFASLCVLASGSAGNCSVLRIETPEGPRLVLIDAGISPRRTRRMLESMGHGLDQIEAVVLTHLDTDHWYAGWLKKLPASARIWAHKRHASRGRRSGVLPSCVQAFEHSFHFDGICPSQVRVSSLLASHDQLGVASFRFEFTPPAEGGEAQQAAALGFATDLGRVRYELVEHLRGVDVLAIESNYCPQLQMASARPWFLKQRIMGGSGHLSNHEALEAVRQIEPGAHVFLLHLSRECNCPQLVESLHNSAPYAFTVTSQTEPTPWVQIPAGGHQPRNGMSRPAPDMQMSLFASPPRCAHADAAEG